MAETIKQSKAHTSESEQEILKKSRDDKYEILAVIPVGETPESADAGDLYRQPASKDLLATLVDDTTTANVIYLGHAVPGTATSAASWRIKKIDVSSGATITWADGNFYFDNIWDNRASLSYS